MLKFGYITELDVPKGMVRVHFTDDDIVSNLLPVSVQASKEDKYSFPFVINEHVWCLMDENCEFGVVGGAIYSQKDKPDSAASEQSIDINIGSGKLKLKVKKQTGALELTGTGDVKVQTVGKVEVIASQVQITTATATITGALAVGGALTAASFGGASGAPLAAPNGLQVTGDAVADGISLKTHKHIGGGSGNITSTPVP